MKTVCKIIILITIVSCTSQNKQNKAMKTFDIETFNSKEENNHYSYISEDGNEVKQNRAKDYYWETIKPKDSILEFYYEYYQNGKLKRSIKRYPKAFAVGVLKEFDTQGNIVKEENLDKPFTYSWENVKKYLETHKVEDIQKQVIGISRWSDAKSTTWTLEFNGEYEGTKGRLVTKLDGKTGEELEVKLFKGKGAVGETGTTAVYDTLYKKD